MRPPPIITVTPRTITPTLGTTSPMSIQRQLITIARWPSSTPRRPTNTRKNSSRNRRAEQSWRRLSRGQKTYLAPVEIGRRLAPYLCRDEPRHACRYEFHAPSASNWSSPRDHGSAWAYPSSCGALGAAHIISLQSIVVRQRCRDKLIFVDVVAGLSQFENVSRTGNMTYRVVSKL
jgi:hypothetical protein